MQLTTLDWIIAVASVLVCFIPGLFFSRRSGQNTTEYFASGRSVPWWLAGLSMVATTFSSDTPNLVTNFVRTQGVAGNWQWWAFTLTGLSTVFFYARLWRRSGALTDLEIYELRYSGRAASVVRSFRAVYLGFFFNCVIMASVNLAACKIASVLFGWTRLETLLGVGFLNVAFAAHSGLWGVLVIDMIQFFIKMAAVIAAAYYAVMLPQVGGLSGLVEKLSARADQGIPYLNMMPDFTNHWEMAVAIFIMPIAVQWWAVWYPGAEPGGGSYSAQRMLASKTERDAIAGTMFFNVAHYVLRPWPWILVGLASLIVYPELSDIKKAFPHVDSSLIGHDIAYPAMLRFLPAGWMGLMLGGLIAANSSTILTHLNWGASYLIHDFYRRVMKPNESEAHYVFAGRVSILLLFLASSALVFFLESAQDNFNIMLQVGAGTGLLYLLRWFWWRITAWCEVVAMVSSFVISVVFLVMRKQGVMLGTHLELLLTVLATTICWLAAAYLGPKTDEAVLVNFYKKVRPPGPGWAHIRAIAGTGHEPDEGTNLPMAMLGWLAGSLLVWCSLFAVGNFLYGRYDYALGLLAVDAVCAFFLVRVIRRLW
jgi:solute:Na+ symporter, SSS family